MEATPPPVSMLAAFGASWVSSASPGVVARAAGAPGLAVERGEADLCGGFVAAAAADQDGAVDEGKLVVFLEEDDQAVRELDAFGLDGLEGVQCGNGNFLPGLGGGGVCGAVWSWAAGECWGTGGERRAAAARSLEGICVS